MGFDDSALVNTEDNLDLLCCVCLEVPLPLIAVRTQCLHVFCQSCLTEYALPACPYCQHPAPVPIKDPKLQLRILRTLFRCHCDIFLDCGWSGPAGLFAKHAQVCRFAAVQIDRLLRMGADVKELVVKYRPSEKMLGEISKDSLKKLVCVFNCNSSRKGAIDKRDCIEIVRKGVEEEWVKYQALRIREKSEAEIEFERIWMKERSVGEIKQEMNRLNVGTENCFEKKDLVARLVQSVQRDFVKADEFDFSSGDIETDGNVLNHSEFYEKKFSEFMRLPISKLKRELSNRNASHENYLEKSELVRKLLKEIELSE